MDAFNPQPLSRERTSDSITQVLRDSILARVFLPGERLHTGELARKLGVSIAPVRDALNRLQAEGLIEIRPRSGTFVSNLTLREVRETFEIRAALECLAAELAVAHLEPENIREFREIFRALDRPIANERDRMLHEQKNSEFHTLLVSLSGNQKLIQIYRQLKAHITIARIHYQRGMWQKRMSRERMEHRRILAAIEARDGEKLQRLLKTHILSAASRLTSDLMEAAEE
jgi:DNA-binding GntR family transcriptional regulator